MSPKLVPFIIQLKTNYTCWIGYFQYFTTQQQPDFRKHMKNYSILKLPNILENVDDLILGYVKAQTYF